MRKKLTAYRHAVWDWNGTLLDDTWLCCAALNQLLSAENRPRLETERYRMIFEFPAIKVYEKLGFPITGGNFEALSARFMDAYENQKAKCTLHPQAVKILEGLSNHGLSHSILSAYEHRLLEQTLADHDVAHRFVKISGSGDIYAGSKEDRARAHLGDLAHHPDEVVYIGDTAHDLDAAKAMGVDCILIAHGYQHRDNLDGLGARVVDSFEELLKEI
ncbi:MAG: HAD family hydrolase [Verrucomicrobia bacterium]|jgi:phosphoglycolate phosphatase|nr:HAD family hydrolase [Verrucomicrobiota bacterium]